MSAERRRAPRMTMSLPVKVWWEDSPPQELSTCDVSSSGLFLCCDPATFPPIGSEIEVQALNQGDGEDPPVIRARIVRICQGGIGIEVLD